MNRKNYTKNYFWDANTKLNSFLWEEFEMIFCNLYFKWAHICIIMSLLLDAKYFKTATLRLKHLHR